MIERSDNDLHGENKRECQTDTQEGVALGVVLCRGEEPALADISCSGESQKSCIQTEHMLEATNAATHSIPFSSIVNFEDFSSVDKIVRIYKSCYKVLNFLKNKLRNKNPVKYSHLTPSLFDPHAIRINLIKLDQRTHYPELFEYFESKPCAKKDVPPIMKKFNINLRNNILVIKGKFGSENFGNEYSMLLHNKSHLTKLFIRDLHEKLKE